MAKKASSTAAKKKKAAPKKQADPNADIKNCKTLADLFDLRPEDKTGVRYQVWVAKGALLAKEAGVNFGPK